MNFEERKKWAEALLACSVIRDRKSRDVIVGELSAEIGTSILRSEIDNIDITNILKRVFGFEHGLAQFIPILHFYEGYSLSIQQIYRLTEDYAEDYFQQALAAHARNQLKDALEDYDRAIQLNPKYTNAYYNRGNVYYNLGKHEHAIADYDQAIQLNSEEAKTYTSRGHGHCKSWFVIMSIIAKRKLINSMRRKNRRKRQRSNNDNGSTFINALQMHRKRTNQIRCRGFCMKSFLGSMLFAHVIPKISWITIQQPRFKRVFMRLKALD